MPASSHRVYRRFIEGRCKNQFVSVGVGECYFCFIWKQGIFENDRCFQFRTFLINICDTMRSGKVYTLPRFKAYAFTARLFGRQHEDAHGGRYEFALWGATLLLFCYFKCVHDDVLQISVIITFNSSIPIILASLRTPKYAPMIARLLDYSSAISPADYNFDETMSTLRYANRAKNITNKPKVREVSSQLLA